LFKEIQGTTIGITLRWDNRKISHQEITVKNKYKEKGNEENYHNGLFESGQRSIDFIINMASLSII
jgi:hypothetical protein